MIFQNSGFAFFTKAPPSPASLLFCSEFFTICSTNFKIHFVSKAYHLKDVSSIPPFIPLHLSVQF